MNISHIEHIGIAVKDLTSARKFYEEILGLKCETIEKIEEQKVITAIYKIGQTKIELLESTDSEGPIGKFIDKKGEGLHHIAYAVKDIEGALSEAEAKGIQLIDKKPRIGAEGLSIAFLHPKSTNSVLFEFCEDKNQIANS